MNLEEAKLYLEHTSKDDFNLEEWQKENRYQAIQVVLKEIERLNNIINNPEDLTLCKMWADTKLKEEIERLKEEIKGYEQERERVLNIIEERNVKAIEYIERDLFNLNIQENIVAKNELLQIKKILKGEDKE